MYFNFTERVYFKVTSMLGHWLERLVSYLPFFRFIRETRNTQTPVRFRHWFRQRVMGKNRNVYWPVHPSSLIMYPQNIYAGIETCPGYMPGCFIQGMGKIYIGDYTQIAPNVGIISANHALHDNRAHDQKEVRIGKYCWLGMGSMIMPGVVLGDYTVVGAGSVVTKSFPEGYCVIAGNPARVIKQIDKEKCVFHRSDFEYNGYIPSPKFDTFRKKFLNVDPFA
ncbi:MAG TPA: acyltransferase [Chitinophagaceae bacterium]|nr:acyltransferase [Chitinophagaceae bacterium]